MGFDRLRRVDGSETNGYRGQNAAKRPSTAQEDQVDQGEDHHEGCYPQIIGKGETIVGCDPKWRSEEVRKRVRERWDAAVKPVADLPGVAW